MLFCLVMDLFSTLCSNSKLFMYADDITILHFIRKHSEGRLQLELDNVSKWCKIFVLTSIFLKCFVLDTIPKKILSCPPVHIQHYRVANVSSIKNFKILGCIFSQDLRWNIFVDSLLKKASKRVYLILCLKRLGYPPKLG